MRSGVNTPPLQTIDDWPGRLGKYPSPGHLAISSDGMMVRFLVAKETDMPENTDTTDIDELSEDVIERTPQEIVEALRAQDAALRETNQEIRTLDERIQDLEARNERYEILRDIVTSITELDADTLDRLVEERRKESEDQ